MSNSFWPHGPLHSRFPCPSPIPRVYLNSYPLSQWCHPTISSSVVPFSSCLQSFPVSESFLSSQFFASGGQSIKVSTLASVLSMNIQDRFPLRCTGCISLLHCLVILLLQLIHWMASELKILSGFWLLFSHTVVSDSLRPHGLQHFCSLSFTIY